MHDTSSSLKTNEIPLSSKGDVCYPAISDHLQEILNRSPLDPVNLDNRECDPFADHRKSPPKDNVLCDRICWLHVSHSRAIEPLLEAFRQIKNPSVSNFVKAWSLEDCPLDLALKPQCVGCGRLFWLSYHLTALQSR